MITSPYQPGWWLASDGKWYPPHTHPTYVAQNQPTSDVSPTTLVPGQTDSGQIQGIVTFHDGALLSPPHVESPPVLEPCSNKALDPNPLHPLPGANNTVAEGLSSKVGPVEGWSPYVSRGQILRDPLPNELGNDPALPIGDMTQGPSVTLEKSLGIFAPQKAVPEPTAPVGVEGMAEPPTATLPRKRRSFLLLSMAVIVAALVGTGIYYASKTTRGPSFFAKESADEIFKAALNTTSISGSVSLRRVSVLATGVTQVDDEQSWPSQGASQLAFGVATYNTVCNPSTCYVRGNSAGLADELHFTLQRAYEGQGKWLSVSSLSQSYQVRAIFQSLIGSLTLGQVVGSFEEPSHLVSRGLVTTKGGKVAEVTGRFATYDGLSNVSITADILATYPHYFTKVLIEGSSNGGHVRLQTKYSKWGETRAPKAPVGALSILPFLPTT